MTDSNANESEALSTADNSIPLSLHFFTASLDLRNHPLLRANKKRRAAYYAVLEYFVHSRVLDNLYVNARLASFQRAILRDSAAIAITDRNQNRLIKSVVNCPLKPWMKQYRYLLLSDLAQILIDELAIRKVCEEIKPYLSRGQATLFDAFKNVLLTQEAAVHYPLIVQSGVTQYHANRAHAARKEVRYLVTANTSAGKSTLINALVGKVISPMKSEAYTARIHCIYDKPAEDGYTSAWDGTLTMDAGEDTLMNYDAGNHTGRVFAATHFSTFVPTDQFRFCLIDTPGVDSAIYREHRTLTRRALREERYDRLLYVFTAANLGTDAELRHLKFVSEHVPHEKILFILNKLDNFTAKDDSIEESIAGIKNDLRSLGYTAPVICPISAYFALLVKKVLTGVALSDDEQDSYKRFLRKFSGKDYDLSRYYPAPAHAADANRSEGIIAAEKSGLLGLERILYGGVYQA